MSPPARRWPRVCLVIGLVLASLGSVARAEGACSSNPNDVLVIGVRGSGSGPVRDDMTGPFMAGFANKLGDGWDVRTKDVDYPHLPVPFVEGLPQLKRATDAALWTAEVMGLGVQYAKSAWDSAPGAKRQILDWADDCPTSPIVIVGYSQGNVVLRRVIPDLPESVRKRILQVTLLADPTLDAGTKKNPGPDANLKYVSDGQTGIAALIRHLSLKQQAYLSVATLRNAHKMGDDIAQPYPADIAPRVRSVCYGNDIVCNTREVLDSAFSTKPGKGFEVMFTLTASRIVPPNVARAAAKGTGLALWSTAKIDGTWAPLWVLNIGVKTHTCTHQPGDAACYDGRSWGTAAARDFLTRTSTKPGPTGTTTVTTTGGQVTTFATGAASGKIIRVSATGTTWFVDSALVRHWIPDSETYLCLTARGTAVLDGLSQDNANRFPDGPWQGRCLDPARVKNKIVRVPTTGTSYMVDGAGVPHWIPDAWTYGCLTARGTAVVQDGIVQQHVDSIGNGQPWQGRCLDPNAVKNKIIRVPATGTAYMVDAAGAPHWIPDAWTYGCLTAKGVPVVQDGIVQQHVDSIGNGQPWQGRCLDPGAVKNKIVRVPATGTSYMVDAAGAPHWIPDAWTYGCLTARGIPVVQDAITQEHVDSIGNGQPWQGRCLDPNAVKNKIVRVPATGASYMVDGAGAPHWIPDAYTYGCLTSRGVAVVQDGIVQQHVDSIGNGQPWQGRCLDRNAVKHRTLRAADTGTTYAVDDTGTIRWIPDGWTYGCMINRYGYGLIDGLTQEQVNSIGAASAPWQPRCLNFGDVVGKVIRVSATGTTYAADGNGVPHWIQNGGIYECFVNKYHWTVIDGLTQQHVDSIGNGQPWATCA